MPSNELRFLHTNYEYLRHLIRYQIKSLTFQLKLINRHLILHSLITYLFITMHLLNNGLKLMKK